MKSLFNTHYLNNKVDNYLSKIKFKNMVVSTFYEEFTWYRRDSINESGFFKDSLGLLIHADNYTDDSLNDFIDSHLCKPEDCLLTMLTFKTDNPSSCGIVEKDSSGKIINFFEKTKDYRGLCKRSTLCL